MEPEENRLVLITRKFLDHITVLKNQVYFEKCVS